MRPDPAVANTAAVMRAPLRRRFGALLTAFLAACLAAAPLHQTLAQASVSVIVREATPASYQAERLVRAAGGQVTTELPIIGGFSARVPGSALGRISDSPAVTAVWSDRKVRVSSITEDLNRRAANTVWQQTIKLGEARKSGYEGSGVTVALLDTGVRDLPDLAGRIVASVDFTPDQDGIDYFGHGTHMAGIIAGDGTMSQGKWKGVAPKAKLVSVKVAGADGTTDVSVVIAGLQWIYAHRAQYDIKVLNLSFGTDSTQTYRTDPLDYAVEQLWLSGVFVSTAAGNRGPDNRSINKPGDDPFVQTVGAADLKNTTAPSDDILASFSSRGPTQDGFLKPEIVAPGVTMVSLRAEGSAIDMAYPGARVGDAYFKGTGTSQSAAVVSGLAALMLQANPALTPDVAKATLVGTANRANGRFGVGTGLVNAKAAVDGAANRTFAATPANGGLVPSTGAGSLELSRGSVPVFTDLPSDGLGAADVDGQLDPLTGEIDALGNDWANLGWTTLAGAQPTNVGWMSTAWSDSAWTDQSGSTGKGWSGPLWSGVHWSNVGWDNMGWENVGWDNMGWENVGWDNMGWENLGWESFVWGSPIRMNIGWGLR
jgi:serine protease AprX